MMAASKAGYREQEGSEKGLCLDGAQAVQRAGRLVLPPANASVFSRKRSNPSKPSVIVVD